MHFHMKILRARVSGDNFLKFALKCTQSDRKVNFAKKSLAQGFPLYNCTSILLDVVLGNFLGFQDWIVVKTKGFCHTVLMKTYVEIVIFAES